LQTFKKLNVTYPPGRASLGPGSMRRAGEENRTKGNEKTDGDANGVKGTLFPHAICKSHWKTIFAQARFLPTPYM
jgi:hypothetical protein